MRLKTALEGYWLDKERDFSPATIRDYQLTFKRFTEFVGGRSAVDTITSDQVRAFLNHLKSNCGLGQKTIQNHWIALSSFWTWAEKELKIAHIIRGHVDAPKYRRRQIVPYTETDVKAMLGACEYMAGAQHARRPTALRDRAMIITLVDTGVRVSELAAFTLANYIRARGQLMVLLGKGNKDRTVFLGKAGQRAIWRYLAERPDATQSEPLFATRTGNHMDRHSIRHIITRMASRAGVKDATVHRFRHTFAINFLRNGGNPLELQQLLGHERMETIRIYVKLASVDLERAQLRASPGDHWDLS